MCSPPGLHRRPILLRFGKKLTSMNKDRLPKPCLRRRIKTSVEDAYFRQRGHTAYQPGRCDDVLVSYVVLFCLTRVCRMLLNPGSSEVALVDLSYLIMPHVVFSFLVLPRLVYSRLSLSYRTYRT